MSRLVVAAALLMVTLGCAGMKTYRTPLTPAEGHVLVPALLATAEGMGLRAHNGASGGALVYLEDGTMLSWQNSADEQDFILLVNLSSDVPEGQREAAWREARVRADQIWQLATETRQQNNVGATVLITPGGGAASGGMVAGTVSSSGQQACRYGTDCGGGSFCRDRGDGAKVCMGRGGPGAYCVYGTDCGSGLFCRGEGVKVCGR